MLSASFIKVVASLDLHDSLVLPLFGRTADFHRIDTRALLGAHTKCPLSFRTAGILFSINPWLALVTLVIKSLAEWRAEQQAKAAAEAPPERPGPISLATNQTAKAA